MQIKDLKFRDIDKHFFFVENLKQVKKIYKKLRIKEEINSILVIGYIDHEKGIQFRILGNIVIQDGLPKIEENFIKNKFILNYDFFEEIEVKEVPEATIAKIDGIFEIEDDLDRLYENESLIQSRANTELDEFRDLRLIDDVHFLLLSREAQQENVWARIEEVENKMFKCTLLDKTKKCFNLKPNDKIYIKYVNHPKYKGLMFVKKV